MSVIVGKWKPAPALDEGWVVLRALHIFDSDGKDNIRFEADLDVNGKLVSYGEWADAQAKADELNKLEEGKQ